jgi:hypothetical protein
LKIEVQPGDVYIESVEVRRHKGGIYSVTIKTPKDRHPDLRLSREFSNTGIRGACRIIELSRETTTWFERIAFTRVTVSAETNDEEEALMYDLVELDHWSKWSVTLIALHPDTLEEHEPAGEWFPSGPIDYIS